LLVIKKLSQAGFLRVASGVLGGGGHAIQTALAGLERDCQGQLATFDRGLRELASGMRYSSSLLAL
jgi:hypothetical protein